MSSSGVVSRRRRVIYLHILLMFDIVLVSCEPVVRAAPVVTEQKFPITVTVTSESGREIITAIARILGTTDVATLQNNKLMLPYCSKGNYISIWAPEHFIKTEPCEENKDIYELTLTPLSAQDNVNYAWMSAQVCASCHSEAQGRTEHSEWNQDRHARVFVDPYFWMVYRGIDSLGNVGTDTKWVIGDSGQKTRLPGEAGPNLGFRLDYPNENGTCAYCHAPTVAGAMEQGLSLKDLQQSVPGRHLNVETEGITCDICHKVTGVLIGQNGLPFPELPGIRSFLFLRPELNQLFHLGPLPDYKPQNTVDPNVPNNNTACSQVFSESRFCAACHYGKFFDTVIYNSYGEWLNSSYSNREISNFRSCQDCHMPSAQSVGDTIPAQRAACSSANQDFRNFNHNMMARGSDGRPELVKNAATVGLSARIENGSINVAVQVKNVGAGHKFPTDSPLRHLILLVEAKDQNGTPLAQMAGSVIPLWGGVGGNPNEDYAGRPGEIYANILKDKDTNEMPTVAYWNPIIPAWGGSDTRLNPGEEVQSEYSFAVPSNGRATISARLIYRYAFIEIIRQKGWPLNDIDVTEPVSVQVP